MLYAEVAVNAVTPYRSAFTYLVPDEMQVRSGQGVLVPFGPRTLQGVVVAVTPTPHYMGDVRPLASVAADMPLLFPYQVELACWLSDAYLAPIFSCVALMLPAGIERQSSVWLTNGDTAGALDAAESAVVETVRAAGRIELKTLRRQLEVPRFLRVVERLVGRGVLKREYGLTRPGAGPRIERGIRLIAEASSGGLDSPLINGLRDAGGTMPLSAVRRIPDWSAASLRNLLSSGQVEQTELHIEREPLIGAQTSSNTPARLSPAQGYAFEQILSTKEPRTSLLHGVTGSGKTEVYLAAVAATVERGRQAIVLVPEIALTPQMIERFAARFPDRVAVLHSGLSAGQRYDQWHATREGRYDVVIGSRSALFAPCPALGLIVMDEEHEWTYKQQDRPPRYHTREVAERLTALTGAHLVLGSATPDVVSYHRALQGRYQLMSLPERVLPSTSPEGWRTESLPQVEIVDLARELRSGNTSIFSRALVEALTTTLVNKEQAILFLNRRGSASFLLCRNCGYVPRCRRCAVSLTYHAVTQRLLCHQCNRPRRVPARCPRCLSAHIRYLGAGTQRVEEMVLHHFPDARVLRWDRDAAQHASDHVEFYERMKRREVDVLVGTQMVAKSLDLPLVTLVGVINADIALGMPDFRSSERTFQLLTQVAGRAGRRDRPGKVIVQAYAPDNYAIQAAAGHDYATFYQQEIGYRQRGAYPPFARLSRLVYAHSSRGQAETEARRLGQELRRLVAGRLVPATQVLGPAPCPVAQLRGRWRWQILLRGPQPAEFLCDVSLPAGWSIDIDAQSFS